jgi:hypothetical protein
VLSGSGSVTYDKRITTIRVVASRAEVETMLSGWRRAMREQNSLDWIIDRVSPDR